MTELVFAKLGPNLEVTVAEPTETVSLQFAMAFKGDPVAADLGYFSLQDINGVEIARVLTGEIQ